MLAVLMTVALALGVNMASTLVTQGGPEQVLQQGPEDLVAASAIIVAGPVSDYSQQVQKYSAPGPDGFPLEWVATAEIKQPQSLKGKAPRAPIHFSRTERSLILPLSPAEPIWERDYGELSPLGQAVLFLGPGDPPSVIKVVPSGEGEQDLAGLVRDIVQIQSVQDSSEQRQRWLKYLATASSDEGRRAALRSLVAGGANWSQIAPALTRLFEHHGANQNSRAFAFEFVAYHVVKETWGEHAEDAVAFLCQAVSSEPDTDLALAYLQGFKLVLAYTAEEPLHKSRQPLRKRILQCVERLAAMSAQNPELEEECKKIREDYAPQ